MNESTIGRNYAEALLALAQKSGDVERWGGLLDGIAAAMRQDQMLRTFLESPKLAAAHKIEILEKALGRRVPRLFLRYIETVIHKRRQMLIPAIASDTKLYSRSGPAQSLHPPLDYISRKKL